MTDADFGYSDPRGDAELRVALADYLGRVRGVVAEPASASSSPAATRRASASSAARSPQRGARRVALEDPSNPEQRG